MTYGTPSATSTLGSTCAGGAADGVPAPAKAGADWSPATGSLEYMCGLKEATIQKTVIEHLQRRAAGAGYNRVGGVVVIHPANGGKHQASDGQRIYQAGQGVLAGVPDLLLFYEGKKYALELKSLKGKLSAKQQAVGHLLRMAGFETHCAYGLIEALAWLERHNLLIGKTV